MDATTEPKDEKAVICKIISDEGLDTEIWIPKLKDQFKLKSIVLLKHVKEEDFEEFAEQIENSAEQAAIRKVFKSVKQRSEDKSDQQNAGTLLDKMKENVKTGRSDIMTKLDKSKEGLKRKSPKEFGKMSSNVKSMKADIESVTARSTVSSGVKENWTAAEAVRKIQAGVLCKGVYASGDLGDVMYEKERVINVKDSLEFSGTVSSHEPFHRTFSSQEMTAKFVRNTDKTQYSGGLSAKVGFMAVAEGGFDAASDKEQEAKTQKERQTSFLSVVYCDKVPVNGVDIELKHVELTPEALESLQNIEQSLVQCNYESKAHFHEFFETFGSHVYIGQVELGGTLISIAYSEDFQEKDRGKVTKIASEAAQLSLSVGFSRAGIDLGLGTSFNAAKLHAKTAANIDSKDLQTTLVHLIKFGGPVEIDDRIEWRKELVKYSSLWRIVSRNSPPKPIWKLLRNHRDQFEDFEQLSEAMERDWENAQDQERYNRMIQVRRWLYKSNRDGENVVSVANDLHEIRKTYYQQDKHWQDEVLYSPEVQEVLTYMVERIPSESLRSRDLLKFSLRSILQPYVDILRLSFLNIEHIINCIEDPEAEIILGNFKVEKVEELIEVLREELENVDKENTSPNDLSRIQKKLELLVKYWSERFYNNLPYLLVVTLLTSFGFSVAGFHFMYNFVSLSEIENLLIRIIETHIMYAEIKGKLKQQAYIVNLALNSPQYQRQKTLHYVFSSLGRSLCEEINNAFEKARRTSETYDLERLVESIVSLLSGEQFDSMIIRALETQLQFLEPETMTTKSTVCSHHPESDDLDLKEETAKVLREFGVMKYYPQKLKYQDVTMIAKDRLDNSKTPTTLEEVPWFFIKHIISLNSETRENCGVRMNMDSDDERNTDSDGESSSYQEVPLYIVENRINPCDLIYVIFLCADDFLRQELVDKMVRCQYAIPFILPPAKHPSSSGKDVLLNWSLQTISRIFFKHRSVKHASLVNEESPLITAVTLGEETSWKSRLLNEMLSPQQKTFWNQTLTGGECKQRISQGLVELAWYLPGGFSNDKNEIPLTFANVRGNAMHCPTVCDTLMDFSSVTLVFTQDIDSANIFLSRQKSLNNVVLVALHRGDYDKAVESAYKDTKKKFKLKRVIYKPADDCHFTTVLQKLNNSIGKTLEKAQGISLTQIANHVKTQGLMEIDDHLSMRGRKAAEKILDDIDETHKRQPDGSKQKILPLQCDIKARQEIASLDKESCRQRLWNGRTTTRKYGLDTKKKKWPLISQQLQKPLSDSFKFFLKCLLCLDPTDRKYFLQCLRLGLNERSTQLLYPLYEQYRECRKETESAERDERLKEIDEQLRHGSLVLEHFFRELALIFEYITSLKDKFKYNKFDGKLKCLAAAMADVLLEGTAIEIMDGDTVHVPVAWLQEVLSCIEHASNSRFTESFRSRGSVLWKIYTSEHCVRP